MKFDRKTLKAYLLATQIGFVAISSVVIGLMMGFWLEDILKDKIWVMVGVILGIALGFKSTWDMLKHLLK